MYSSEDIQLMLNAIEKAKANKRYKYYLKNIEKQRKWSLDYYYLHANYYKITRVIRKKLSKGEPSSRIMSYTLSKIVNLPFEERVKLVDYVNKKLVV